MKPYTRAARGFLWGVFSLGLNACVIGPVDYVRITGVIPGDGGAEAGDLSYAITVEYQLTLFQADMTLLFNTESPDDFTCEGAFDEATNLQPAVTVNRGAGTHTFDVRVKRPAWESAGGALKTSVRLNKKFGNDKVTLGKDERVIEEFAPAPSALARNPLMSRLQNPAGLR